MANFQQQYRILKDFPFNNAYGQYVIDLNNPENFYITTGLNSFQPYDDLFSINTNVIVNQENLSSFGDITQLTDQIDNPCELGLCVDIQVQALGATNNGGFDGSVKSPQFAAFIGDNKITKLDDIFDWTHWTSTGTAYYLSENFLNSFDQLNGTKENSLGNKSGHLLQAFRTTNGYYNDNEFHMPYNNFFVGLRPGKIPNCGKPYCYWAIDTMSGDGIDQYEEGYCHSYSQASGVQDGSTPTLHGIIPEYAKNCTFVDGAYQCEDTTDWGLYYGNLSCYVIGDYPYSPKLKLRNSEEASQDWNEGVYGSLQRNPAGCSYSEQTIASQTGGVSDSSRISNINDLSDIIDTQFYYEGMPDDERYLYLFTYFKQDTNRKRSFSIYPIDKKILRDFLNYPSSNEIFLSFWSDHPHIVNEDGIAGDPGLEYDSTGYLYDIDEHVKGWSDANNHGSNEFNLLQPYPIDEFGNYNYQITDLTNQLAYQCHDVVQAVNSITSMYDDVSEHIQGAVQLGNHIKFNRPAHKESKSGTGYNDLKTAYHGGNALIKLTKGNYGGDNLNDIINNFANSLSSYGLESDFIHSPSNTLQPFYIQDPLNNELDILINDASEFNQYVKDYRILAYSYIGESLEENTPTQMYYNMLDARFMTSTAPNEVNLVFDILQDNMMTTHGPTENVTPVDFLLNESNLTDQGFGYKVMIAKWEDGDITEEDLLSEFNSMIDNSGKLKQANRQNTYIWHDIRNTDGTYNTISHQYFTPGIKYIKGLVFKYITHPLDEFEDYIQALWWKVIDIKINVNTDEIFYQDFAEMGGLDFTFIPWIYPAMTPTVGGVTESSKYNKSVKAIYDSNLFSQNESTEYLMTEAAFLNDELGKHLGKVDIEQMRFFKKPHNMDFLLMTEENDGPGTFTPYNNFNYWCGHEINCNGEIVYNYSIDSCVGSLFINDVMHDELKQSINLEFNFGSVENDNIFDTSGFKNRAILVGDYEVKKRSKNTPITRETKIKIPVKDTVSRAI